MVRSPVLVSLALLTGGATTSNARWLDPVTPAAALWSNGDHAARLARAHDFLGDSFVAVDGTNEARDAEYDASLEWSVRAMKLTAPETVKDLAAGVTMVMAVKKAPNYLGTKVLWAQFLCPKTGDKALAKKLLEEAVAADPSDQHKAKTLLANFDSLFAL